MQIFDLAENGWKVSENPRGPKGERITSAAGGMVQQAAIRRVEG